MLTAGSLLKIDEKRTVSAIIGYIRNKSTRHSSGVLIGLSGGIDSALHATLTFKALGRDAVHTTYLYDRDSEKRLALRARQMADWLGVDFDAQNIEPALKSRGVYRHPYVQLTRLNPEFNRFIYRMVHFFSGETGFMISLRAGTGKEYGSNFKNKVMRSINHSAEFKFYARHRYRREILEQRAQRENLLILGAANRTEWMTGWFVRDGIDDMPFQPLLGLYKTQVRQLALFLGLPSEILTQAPSPDMMKGVTDEFALGMPYSLIDVVLDHLEGGVSSESLGEMGITDKELDHVRKMKDLSGWKRRPLPEPFAVDGGPDGGFRI